MKYQLVSIENGQEVIQELHGFWNALGQAMILLDRDVEVKGIKAGEDLLGEDESVMRGEIIAGIRLLMPDNWRE